MKKILLTSAIVLAVSACGNNEGKLVDRAGSDQNEFYHLAGDIDSFDQYMCYIKEEPKEVKEERCIKTLTVTFNEDGNILREAHYHVPSKFSSKGDAVGLAFVEKTDLSYLKEGSVIEIVSDYDKRGNRLLLDIIQESPSEKIHFDLERKIANNAEIFIHNDGNQQIKYRRTRTYGGDKYVSSDNEIILHKDKNKRVVNREFEYNGLGLGEVGKVTTTTKSEEWLLSSLVDRSIHTTTQTYKYDSEGYMIAEDIEVVSKYSNMPGNKEKLLKTFDIYEKDQLNWTKRLVIWEKKGKSHPVYFEKRKIRYRD